MRRRGNRPVDAPPYECAVWQRCQLHCEKMKEGEDMIQMAAGIVLGVMICAVTALVAGCIYLEHKHPEVRDRLRYEAGGEEV